ncbi:MAG: uroporphyrinogen decarboxylase [Caulobacteraceae bacterium]|nr:uroporphyrinogen decarboxylase [Caulobacter sp.]
MSSAAPANPAVPPSSAAARPALLRVLAGERLARPPVWFMRQAGRYLPEYRALRATAPDFVSFCLDPEKAAEVTLQPMRRLPYDAAIVFADILLIPKALGQEVRFEAGEGPRLGDLPEVAAMAERAAGAGEALSAVGETLSRVRSALEPERALIGFAGAPWTVATYMLQGRGGERDAAIARAYAEPEMIDALLDVLVESTAHYLLMQARAGAQALQLFESWAEGLAEDLFARLVTGPHARLLARLRELGCDLPVIGFPRGAGALVEGYAEAVPVQGVGLDTQATAALGRRLQGRGLAIQGALDPILLRAGGPALDRRVEGLLEQWGEGPYIFNLGHGIWPDTPIPHVERVLARITGVSP